MSSMKRLERSACGMALGFFALAFVGHATAAPDAIVPTAWNVAPMRSGAYLEAFDLVLPVWAGRVGGSFVTNIFPPMAGSGLPSRENSWFDLNNRVLSLDTEGGAITNRVAHPNQAPVTFATQPLYVDMRVRFDVMSDPPSQDILDHGKLAIYVNADRQLVAVHAGGTSVHSPVLDTNLWHQLTVKLQDGAYDVLLNDTTVFAGLALRNVGTPNTLEGAQFRGTGLIDELYVSHGNPAYAIAGPTTSIPELPLAGVNPPTDEQQTRINAWLSGQPGLNSLGAMSQDDLSRAYLLGALALDGAGVASLPHASFGISRIEMISPTQLTLTARLRLDDVNKNDPINGRIQLQGKVGMDDPWTTLVGAITPMVADFTDGEATYTYTIPSGGYQFFRPLIVP